MNKIIAPSALMAALALALALALVLPPQAHSQSNDPSNEEIRRMLQDLSQRVGRLESENRELKQENIELKNQQDRLDATAGYLRTEVGATRKELAEDAHRLEKIGTMEKSLKSGEWASRLSWKGDFRYRHEMVDPEEAVTEQTRHRARARFGLGAKITDTVSGTIQLATGGGNGDPRSTNQTLGSGSDRKQVAIDLAYIDWKAMDGLNVQLGKMPLPMQRVGSMFWDGDITPEGAALKFSRGTFFANAFSYYLSERSSASDTTFSGAQLGLKGAMGGTKLMAAVAYYDVGAVLGEVTAQPGGCTSSFNNAFFGGAQGNTTVAVSGCPRLANDFNMVEALAQADFKVGYLPMTLFANYIRNQEAGALDTGLSAGFTLGKASDAKTWEFGYIYQSMEKDAHFGQFIDSDFGGGVTDTEGSVIRFGYAPMKNWTLNGTWFLNDRFVDVGTQRDYKRLQLDMNFRF